MVGGLSGDDAVATPLQPALATAVATPVGTRRTTTGLRQGQGGAGAGMTRGAPFPPSSPSSSSASSRGNPSPSGSQRQPVTTRVGDQIVSQSVLFLHKRSNTRIHTHTHTHTRAPTRTRVHWGVLVPAGEEGGGGTSMRAHTYARLRLGVHVHARTHTRARTRTTCSSTQGLSRAMPITTSLKMYDNYYELTVTTWLARAVVTSRAGQVTSYWPLLTTWIRRGRAMVWRRYGGRWEPSTCGVMVTDAGAMAVAAAAALAAAVAVVAVVAMEGLLSWRGWWRCWSWKRQRSLVGLCICISVCLCLRICVFVCLGEKREGGGSDP